MQGRIRLRRVHTHGRINKDENQHRDRGPRRVLDREPRRRDRPHRVHDARADRARQEHRPPPVPRHDDRDGHRADQPPARVAQDHFLDGPVLGYADEVEDFFHWGGVKL